MRRRRNNRGKSSIWRAYSDMMSGLLLLFILIMAVYLMQAQKNYTEKLAEQAKLIKSQSELEESQKMIEEQQSALEEQESELSKQAEEIEGQRTSLQEKESELSEQKITLAEQAKMLEELQTALETQESELTQKESEVNEANALITQRESEIEKTNALLEEKESELNQSQSEIEKTKADLEKTNEALLDGYIKLGESQEKLDNANAMMAAQQEKIDRIIGVKAELIEGLNRGFRNAKVNVKIDKDTGAILLDSNVLYEFGKSELTDAGKEILDEILPVYCYMLLSDEYINDIGEIIIDGYADSVGEYNRNLKLSQDRAYAVAIYMLESMRDSLTEDQYNTLTERLTANGKSSSNPIIDENGEEDEDASRRVEIKFRLKDEEMIAQLQEIVENGRSVASGIESDKDVSEEVKKAKKSKSENSEAQTESETEKTETDN